jgi:hypothetical protein
MNFISMLDSQADTAYDPFAIFDENSPLDPMFMADAVQTVMRAMPLDIPETEAAQRRRMNAGLIAIAATNPRDPIEIMLAVQAISAYQASCACWRIGMNSRYPRGDSTRHISAAATAARTFDTMLRAIERRQAKPLSVPVGRPPARVWTDNNMALALDRMVDRIRRDDEAPGSGPATQPPLQITWTPEALAVAREIEEADRFEAEHAGLDLANTEGILPGGGMIMPEEPTPNQAKYIARRLMLKYKREQAENLRKGIKGFPEIMPLRTGDFVP